MSCTLRVPLWLKSPLQQGLVKSPGALQAVPSPAKELPVPVQLWGGVMLQEDPQQQAPRQMVFGVQTPGMTMPF